ncbi:MAG TPA: UDP-N-acetylglucosamine 2-epimerase (non-hydrolyzing) [Candidatus Acidoferrum sp.]|nr:UDP-N-acetylglucosamine 2-epimerase (non-hydrolyzing) [Candidatus Acidoferrum sp.]
MKLSEPRNNGSAVKWISIVGARPQFVKLAPVVRAIREHNAKKVLPRIDHCIIHTGQHYDRELNKLMFAQMEISEPDVNLGAGSGSHGQQLARMLGRLEPILASKCPDWVVIYGDTNSTLAGALLAARMKLRVAHVEAGCRSDDFGMPEEQNRIVSDHLSQLLLAPSESAMANLHREGIGLASDPFHRQVKMVGDVMHDALVQNLELIETFAEENLQQFGLERGRYYLLTLHRAENTDTVDRIQRILEAVGGLDFPVLFPVHPRTRQILAHHETPIPDKVRPVSPVGYLDMLALEKHARKILTDSGGVQKEAFYLGVPCVTLRDRTEWPETVQLGANRVVGNSPEAICEAARANHVGEWRTSSPYGDGRAAERILDELLFANGHRKLALS